MINPMCFDSTEEFFKWLKIELHRRGMSYKKLADKIGIHTNTLSGYIVGRHEPSVFMIICICTALGYKLGVVLDDTK